MIPLQKIEFVTDFKPAPQPPAGAEPRTVEDVLTELAATYRLIRESYAAYNLWRRVFNEPQTAVPFELTLSEQDKICCDLADAPLEVRYTLARAFGTLMFNTAQQDAQALLGLAQELVSQLGGTGGQDHSSQSPAGGLQPGPA